MGSIKRKLLAPFDKVGRKLKQKAERFVLKTISKNPSILPQSQATAPQQYPPSMSWVMQYLQATQNRAFDAPKGLDAVAISDQWLLARHPLVDFVYVDKEDLVALPQILFQSYQLRETAIIEKEFAGCSRVLHLNAGFGYHTLTIASCMANSGQLVALESNPIHRATLELNLRAHGLHGLVTLPRVTDSGSDLIEFLGCSNPWKIYVTAGKPLPSSWSDQIRAVMSINQRTELWCGDRLLELEQLSSLSVDGYEGSRQAA